MFKLKFLKKKEPIILSPKEAERLAYWSSTTPEEYRKMLDSFKPYIDNWEVKQLNNN